MSDTRRMITPEARAFLQAAEYLEKHGWIQGRMYDECEYDWYTLMLRNETKRSLPACAFGALMRVTAPNCERVSITSNIGSVIKFTYDMSLSNSCDMFLEKFLNETVLSPDERKEILEGVTGENPPLVADNISNVPLSVWNDMPERTKEEVLVLFRAAAAAHMWGADVCESNKVEA